MRLFEKILKPFLSERWKIITIGVDDNIDCFIVKTKEEADEISEHLMSSDTGELATVTTIRYLKLWNTGIIFEQERKTWKQEM